MEQKALKILVMGATGFTGRQVLAQLAAYNRFADKANKPKLQVTAFCRGSSAAPTWEGDDALLIARGDLTDPVSMEAALYGKDGLIYVASLGFGHGPAVVAACERAGVKRAVFVSTTAIFTNLEAATKEVRMAAEAAIVASTLDWTILRPTMIYGRRGDRNMERLVRYLKRYPLILVPGRAGARQQPVFVDDVANAVVQAFRSKTTIRRAYNISGKTPLSFAQVIRETASALGKKRKIIEVPLQACCLALRLYAKLSKHPRLKEEQLLRLNEDKVFDHAAATADFGFAPLAFRDGVRRLVEELRA